MIRFISLFVLMALPNLASADVKEIERLVDRLVDVSEPGVGYSILFSGSDFLPYDDAEQLGTFVIGGTSRTRSETLRELILRGADAVPVLVKHIGDERKIKMDPLKIRSLAMWMSFDDEYDFNDQTRKSPPFGVNRTHDTDPNRPDSHAVTVGDLCFVALGQIANRHFAATRYQPTGGTIISSPTHSKRLREVIISDWSDLTREKHKQLLMDDFKNPDYEGRLIGAYQRLALYYPEVVEELVLNELSKPTYDSGTVYDFCREKLYKTAEKDQRKRLFDEFVSNNGKDYVHPLQDQLFQDLETLEAHEEKRISPPLTEYSTQPRELLIQLFKHRVGVKSEQRPFLSVTEVAARARFIEALTHDKSRKIGESVHKLYLANERNGYFAGACLTCLANRGYGEFLVDQLKKIDLSETEFNERNFPVMEGICRSKDPVVQQQLLEVLRTTKNDDYFRVALPAAKLDDPRIFDWATRLLDDLPDNTKSGDGTLRMICDRYPDKAPTVLKKFYTSKGPNRAYTVCKVLWYGSPISKEVLTPLLQDERELEGYNSPTKVCERAAEALSHWREKK